MAETPLYRVCQQPYAVSRFMIECDICKDWFHGSAVEVLLRMQGGQVTQRNLEKQGFQNPIMVSELEGLGLQLPPPSFSVRDVEQHVEGDKVIDVIDVARQADSRMTLWEIL
ncbi:hypothetical protein AAFF_G00061560 [Aldrovandia affinis]|uniref:Uncharacterized protein n=1 Tax=Aldrovandia affinis TaxID=143900 RepID=A0AAD7WEX2_9TELE|nr:hypothetical protein AAFF_G00061560 [Aldrovandia affinis]